MTDNQNPARQTNMGWSHTYTALEAMIPLLDRETSLSPATRSAVVDLVSAFERDKYDPAHAEERREQKLATIVAPDNGTPNEVLSAVLECATAWVPEARIIGNVRAGDIARAVRSVLATKETAR